jgi:hypothetical protein
MTTNESTKVTASMYAAMTRIERINYDISILDNPLTGAGDREVAEWRLNNSKVASVEWASAAILLTDNYQEGSKQHNALMDILAHRQKEIRIIAEFLDRYTFISSPEAGKALSNV